MKFPNQSIAMKRSLHLASYLVLAWLLSGCLLTAPFWNQSFDSHTDTVAMQAWTTSSGVSVRFECTQAYHGGLYPPFSTPSWTLMNTVTPANKPSYDTQGTAVYSVPLKRTVPSSCWRQDPGNGIWYAAIRTRHSTSSGNWQEYATFDQAGLACLGSEIGSEGNWLAWIGCQEQSGSSNINFVIIHADS